MPMKSKALTIFGTLLAASAVIAQTADKATADKTTKDYMDLLARICVKRSLPWSIWPWGSIPRRRRSFTRSTKNMKRKSLYLGQAAGQYQ